jgi:putative heme-binding domain-containing protein
MTGRFILLALAAGLSLFPVQSMAGDDPDTLEKQLLREGPEALARAARERGDASRGAIVFYQPALACIRCHTAPTGSKPVGPYLTRPAEKLTGTHLVEAVLTPSKAIRKGFETVTVVTKKGRSITGVLVEDGPSGVVLLDSGQDFKRITIPRADFEQRTISTVSLMPTGLANQLGTRQQFLDLVRYLIEITEKGPARARELTPDPSLFAQTPVPEYEKTIDHAGLIRALDDGSFRRGKAVYERVCANCHGTRERIGSLPAALRFAEGKFKNGSDPYSMYQTLTRGFGMMIAQSWMVPRQKYDVIHYIRKAYLAPHNRSQYTAVDGDYLARLPKGTSRGPAPSSVEPWVVMDYGPSLINTYEVGKNETNFAYKGIAVRLDPGPGGVSRGRYWMLYDHDIMRLAAAWDGRGFIDWNGIHFNGQHQVHPHIVGQTHLTNPMLPGWANPADGSFTDPRIKGRDDRHYGPLPRPWAHYRGLYHYENRVILSSTVGKVSVLEMPGLLGADVPVFTRTFNLGPRDRELVLQVAQVPGAGVAQRLTGEAASRSMAVLLGKEAKPITPSLSFDGRTQIEVAQPAAFDLARSDFTIHARIRTREGGTIFSRAAAEGKWVPDAEALFIDNGRLVFDIGWVGQVRSQKSVTDGRLHDVAMTSDHQTGQVRLYIDGQPDGEKKLQPRKSVKDHIVRLGYAAPNFPRKQSFFKGTMSEVCFYRRALTPKEIAALPSQPPDSKPLVARWKLDPQAATIKDESGNGHEGKLRSGPGTPFQGNILVAGVSPPPAGAEWVSSRDGLLRLKLPAGKAPLRFTLWFAAPARIADAQGVVASVPTEGMGMDLAPLTRGGPPRWPARLKTVAQIGKEDGPFAVDVLTQPLGNPWSCQMRFTGLDFFPDGKRAAVCSWDGDVWAVSGIDHPAAGLTWQRIASGLFQPLGLRIVDGQVYVGCRDQIVILRDLNGDGETDFYENFNDDHQVTEHFHEFAMGLQTDAKGNFYYAKAARHAKTALVPQHGTLLRVSKDGSKTDILATGFRAPNGVCLNPDGTFFLTDQEGHWTPKNRINWVKPGHYYGNFWGYHNVTDSSDAAMEPPVCWITNSFDRSPGECLWVDSKSWGPLQGSLLNLSYGMGKVFVVLHETVQGQMQGGMCALPIPPFPTGVMRGRFHPKDGNLFLCGMFAWAGNRQQPGGFYRMRYTGQPLGLPVGLAASKGGLTITFTDKLDPKTVADPANYTLRVWGLKRSANYGSKHLNEHPLPVKSARLTADGRGVFLEIPGIAPTRGMQIRYAIRDAAGQPVEGVIHNTIHRLAEK